jgi:hypothetical protein
MELVKSFYMNITFDLISCNSGSSTISIRTIIPDSTDCSAFHGNIQSALILWARKVSDSSYSASYKKLAFPETSLICKVSSHEYDLAVIQLVRIKAAHVEHYISIISTIRTHKESVL